MHDHVVSAVAADPAAGGAAPRAARRLTLDAVAGLGPVHPRLAGAECGGRDRDRQIAFILVVGILIDTFIVRVLLVPAASYDLGRAIWWPSTLDRQRDDTPRWPLERDRADVPGSARSP